jgi:hypothetical protein
MMHRVLLLSCGLPLWACADAASSDAGGQACVEDCLDVDEGSGDVTDAGADTLVSADGEGVDAFEGDVADGSADADVVVDAGPDDRDAADIGGADDGDAAENLDGADVDAAPPACAGDTVNACGGCAVLAGVLGAVCGECEDGTLVCDGPEALRCAGAEGERRTWYVDGDDDGFGSEVTPGFEACESPFEGAVTVRGDCNDRQMLVNPDAVEVCNGVDDDCDPETLEVDSECADGLTCAGGSCVGDCAASQRCGADSTTCCEPSSICVASTCVPADVRCENSDQCEAGEFCEPLTSACISRELVTACEYRPPVGIFTPEPECRWDATGQVNPTRTDVVATPVVANLTDDNSDGVTDTRDTPDIVFLSYDRPVACCNTPATIRVVSGRCNPDGTMRTIASISSPTLTNDAGLALADLNNDGVAEIIAIGLVGGQATGTVAFTRSEADGSAWEVLWHNTTYPSWGVHTRGGPVISVADLDGNGNPEVIVGNVVLNGRNGNLKWDGAVTSSGAGGIGNNAFLGPSSAVADIDLDGSQEVLAGNTLYDGNGAVLWTYNYTTSNSTCGGTLPCDGFNAIANMDADPEGEAIIVRLGEIHVLNHDGSPLWRRAIPRGGCEFNESGPPTVADFDGDGQAEIGTASADWYVVADIGCSGSPPPAGCSDDGILWRVPNNDCSSRATGSSVFDFEGDGAAEVIYADETNLRILSGADGTILFDDDTFRSHTRIEMPVVVDVDNDGNAEIVVAENRNGSTATFGGIEVWGDSADNWVRTRRIWNQHGYNLTNVTETGGIPRVPEVNWSDPRYNNWRQNTQPQGVFDAPDLQVAGGELTSDRCPTDRFRLRFSVRNEGAVGVAAGVVGEVDVREFASEPWIAAAVFETTVDLLPGGEQALEVFVDPGLGYDVGTVDIRIRVDQPSSINECQEGNNRLVLNGVGCY